MCVDPLRRTGLRLCFPRWGLAISTAAVHSSQTQIGSEMGGGGSSLIFDYSWASARVICFPLLLLLRKKNEEDDDDGGCGSGRSTRWLRFAASGRLSLDALSCCHGAATVDSRAVLNKELRVQGNIRTHSCCFVCTVCIISAPLFISCCCSRLHFLTAVRMKWKQDKIYSAQGYAQL